MDSEERFDDDDGVCAAPAKIDAIGSKVLAVRCALFFICKHRE